METFEEQQTEKWFYFNNCNCKPAAVSHRGGHWFWTMPLYRSVTNRSVHRTHCWGRPPAIWGAYGEAGPALIAILSFWLTDNMSTINSFESHVLWQFLVRLRSAQYQGKSVPGYYTLNSTVKKKILENMGIQRTAIWAKRCPIFLGVSFPNC